MKSATGSVHALQRTRYRRPLIMKTLIEVDSWLHLQSGGGSAYLNEWMGTVNEEAREKDWSAHTKGYLFMVKTTLCASKTGALLVVC